jgi:nucleoside-diphosphate-sugar epimerase
MNVLITGGAGYIGSSFVNFLLKHGHYVTVLDRFVTPVMPFSVHPHLLVYQGDVRDRKALQAVTRGIDIVVHLAFVSNDPEYELDAKIAESVNLEGTNNICDEAQKAGVKRFIFASSCSIYGSCRGTVTEQAPPSPLTDYARHKLLCEKIVLSRNGSMECIAIRPATVFGPSPQMRFDLLINRMAAQAVTHGVVKAPRPHAMRPVTAMEDLHKVFLRLLDETIPSLHSSCFNLASAERKVWTWAEWIAQLLGAKVEAPLDSCSADARSYSVSCFAIQEILGLSLSGKKALDEQVRAVSKIVQDLQPTDVLNHPNHVRLRSQATHRFGVHIPLERRL